MGELSAAERDQFNRNKSALDALVAELVKSVAQVGDAKVTAEEHMRDADNFNHSAHHRKVEAAGHATYDKAVAAYVRLIRGPRPQAETT